jgi:signal transduction histidine kinase
VAVPVAFLTAVVRRQLARTAVLTVLHEVQSRPTPEAVQQSLRTALGDPSLRVNYWAPELQAYVDVGGLRVEPMPDPGLRLIMPISTAGGDRLAIIDADPSLRRHPEVVTGAVSASGLALENAQLQASVRAQLAQVRASRLRIIEAGVVERRRLERDLHDGAQQRLLALRLALAAADDGTLLPSEQVFLRDVGQEVAVTLAELRDLARGIHPAVLSQAGLAAAVEAIVERQSMLVDPQLPDRRFPAAIEATAYFIICEALDNAARHALATQVRIRGHAAEGMLTIEVEDDGQGGAQVRIGAGISGLIDRVRALGGDLMISSPPGRGTLLVAAIPCG